jgi:cysteine desulfurase
MPRARTYLDHNATTPLRPEARAALLAALDLNGNASSVHAEGRRARAAIETAREQLASLVGAMPREIVFTSGGTESNNAAVRAGWDAIIVAGVEHDSVLAPARSTGTAVIDLPVGATGVVDLGMLENLLPLHAIAGRRTLLSLQLANNETGIVQPVAEAAALARRHGFAVHTDAVQAAGKMPVTFATLGTDLMTLSAHKFGGPKGIGALVVKDATILRSLLTGGGQERGYRAGTENVAGIAAFGGAAEAAGRDLSSLHSRLRDWQAELEHGVKALNSDAVIAGDGSDRLGNTTCIAVSGMSAETLVIALDLAGIAVSAGAACSSGKVKTSHVLTAMGLPPEIAGSAIRVSTGWTTTRNDIDAFLDAFGKVTQFNRPARKVA